MSLTIDIVALVIPIKNIERVYPGGFAKYKQDNAKSNRLLFDYDEHLVRIGSMDSGSIESQIRVWEEYGLIAYETDRVQPVAKDFYYIHNWAKAKRECLWLGVDEERSCVYWKDPLYK